MEAMRNFFLEGGNMYAFLLVATVFFVGAIAAIVYGSHQKWQFRKVWKDVLNSLINELNVKGLDIANFLIEIAMISADKNAALNIGMFKKAIEDNEDNPKFYTKLSEIIEGINDNNHTANLNSDYALARDAIKEAVSLVKIFSGAVGNFEDFANLSISACKAKEDISLSVSNLNGILYGYKVPKFAEEVVASPE